MIADSPLCHLFGEGLDSQSLIKTKTTEDVFPRPAKASKQLAHARQQVQVLQNSTQKAEKLWSKILQLMGGEFYQLAHIDAETYAERVKEDEKC